MKAISVRFNVHQGNWLKAQAKGQGVHCSEYVRDLITIQMKEPHFFEYFRAVEDQTLTSAIEQKHLIYSLMAYKLVEQLVLNHEGGQQKREVAYTATLEWLEKLKIHPGRKRGCKLNLSLYPEQLDWLNQQSKVLNKKAATIVRKIVFLASLKATEKVPNLVSNTDLTEVQREELKAVLMTFNLLKTYIESAYEEGDQLVKNCYESAQTLYKKLYPA